MGLIARRIGVADLQRTAAFYRNAFEFHEEGGAVESGGFLVQRLVDARGATLELVKAPDADATRRPNVLTIGHYGLTHLAFLVESLDQTRAKVLENGGRALDHTRVPMLNDWAGMYLADPDGTRIEIVEGTGMAPLLSHSGITVRDIADSLAFYEAFGFQAAESYDMRDPQDWMAQLNELEGMSLFAQMVRDPNGHTLQLLDIAAPAVSQEPRSSVPDSLGLFELVVDGAGERGELLRDPDGVRVSIAR